MYEAVQHEVRECDIVLRDQAYRTPQGAVIHGYRAMVE
jgi:hypothetical protein